jgi:hypothetical protein
MPPGTSAISWPATRTTPGCTSPRSTPARWAAGHGPSAGAVPARNGVGAPRRPPHPPDVRSAPARPWRSPTPRPCTAEAVGAPVRPRADAAARSRRTATSPPGAARRRSSPPAGGAPWATMARSVSVTWAGVPISRMSLGARVSGRALGHHLSLDFTLVPGKPVAVTPASLGANPAEARTGALKGLRTLAAEQHLARTLAQGMDAAQRRRMVIAAQSLGDIVSGPGRGQSLAVPAGIPAADPGPAQRERLVRLVEEFARNMRAEIADDGLRRLREAGVESVHFAWRGTRCRRSLLPDPRPDGPDRARQHAERGQPRPLGLARSAERLRRRPAARPLPARPPPRATATAGASETSAAGHRDGWRPRRVPPLTAAATHR